MGFKFLLLTSSLHQCGKQVLSRCGWCYSLVSCWANRRCPLQMAFFQFCNLRHDIFYQCTPTSNGYLQIISNGYIRHVFSIFLKVAWLKRLVLFIRRKLIRHLYSIIQTSILHWWYRSDLEVVIGDKINSNNNNLLPRYFQHFPY